MDFYLTTAEEQAKNLLAASRMFAAMARTESGSQAVAEVFPWSRHLSAAEQAEFAAELSATLSGSAELIIGRNAHEVVVGWRGTARIKADRHAYQQALTPTDGDHGPAEVVA